jgi:16S rRNA (guanine527-N7)-methyltransferase
MDPFVHSLRDASLQAGISLSEEQMERLAAYHALVMEANRSFNLTAIDVPGDAAARHIVDSLAPPALSLLRACGNMIDVGTGAGFPGVPIAVYFADKQVTLLDSNRKKTRFLEMASMKVGLSNIEVVTARAEDYARADGREAYDAALSRAVAPLNILLEYLLPLVRPGGCAVAWKGPSASVETEAASNACAVLGGDGMEAYPYSLEGYGTFNIVAARKYRPTPPNFPRKAGKPVKSPIM